MLGSCWKWLLTSDVGLGRLFLVDSAACLQVVTTSYAANCSFSDYPNSTNMQIHTPFPANHLLNSLLSILCEENFPPRKLGIVFFMRRVSE